MGTTTETTVNNSSKLSQACKHWLAFTNRLGELGQQVHQQLDGTRSPEQRGEITESLFLLMSNSALLVARMDPDYPEFLPWNNSGYLCGNPNPDGTYHMTRLRGSGTYRITGNRGTVAIVDLQVSEGFPGLSNKVSTLHNIFLDEDINIGADGAFEILMSPERPSGYTGDWVELDPALDDEVFLMLRQNANDTLTETDARLTIQRIDQPINQRRLTADEIGKRMLQVPKYIEKMVQAFNYQMTAQHVGVREPNCLEDVTRQFGATAVTKNLSYFSGDVCLEADQALILEIDFPATCPYWNMQLMDNFYNSLDFMFHQTSLNGHQSHVDPDGKVRIVVSLNDPGVANWLDTMGYEDLEIIGRAFHGDVKIPVSKTVQLGEVKKHLHPETPSVSFEQRQEMLRKRITGMQLRKRW